jgi:transposase
MSTKKFIGKLTGLKGLRVTDWYFSGRGRTLTICAKPWKNGRMCPVCGRRSRAVQRRRVRRWRDIPICGKPVYLQYAPVEINCPSHGRVQERIPWAEPESRITYRLEYSLLRYCQQMPQKIAAELVHLSALGCSRTSSSGSGHTRPVGLLIGF